MQADPESDFTPEQRGPSSTLDKLAAEKEETTGAPSHPLPINDDEPPPQQTMSRADKKQAEAPAADEVDERGRRPLPKKGDHVAYVDKELKDWHTKWWEVWKDPVTTVYGCCLPCSLAGQNVNRVSDGSEGEGSQEAAEMLSEGYSALNLQGLHNTRIPAIVAIREGMTNVVRTLLRNIAKMNHVCMHVWFQSAMAFQFCQACEFTT